MMMEIIIEKIEIFVGVIILILMRVVIIPQNMRGFSGTACADFLRALSPKFWSVILTTQGPTLKKY
jgi:hypothetical protein